jgi:hypothetical protein
MSRPVQLTSQNWSGHWHGYSWTGSGDDYFGAANESSKRRPGGPAFKESKVPPVMTGHWLLRRAQTAPARTWSDPIDALRWLERFYENNTPQPGYLSAKIRLPYALNSLPRGVDVTWAYWTKSRSFASASLVACANLHHPHIPCPLPPS